jgi:predicted permease
MESIFQDIRFGGRVLVQKPWFTMVAVLSLALGIGANTAIFSLVNAALFRPLPVPNPQELISLNNVTDQMRMFPTFSYPNYKDIRDRCEVFSGLYAYRYAPLSLSHDGMNERLWGYVVTGTYFEVLGVKPSLGRLISSEDDQLRGGHPVSVISYPFWQKRFGGRADVLGTDLQVNGRMYTIIGVTPKGFFGTEVISAPEMYFPMSMQEQIEVGNGWLDSRSVENVFIQGRLKPGVRVSQAQSTIDSIARDLEREYPDINEGKRITLSTPGLMGGMMRGPVVGFAGILMAVVGLVLLLACTNLANLLLARATERRKEIAVRLAMGASRARLIRQLLTESVMLGVAGGGLGLLLAVWLVDLAVTLKPPVDVPLSFELPIDHRVLLFTLGVSILAGILFGLLPAFQSTKTDLVSTLKDEMAIGGMRRSWLKPGLIVLQVALSLVLLISAGLMLRGLQRAEFMDLGFTPEGAIEVSFDLRLQGYDVGRGREFQKRLLERVRAVPGVQAAGIADIFPVDLHFSRESIFVEGQPLERPANAPRAMGSRVTPGYFQAMNTRLIQGREFTDQDIEGSTRVAIVNETFARRFWPGEDPIGKRFSRGSSESQKMLVVGVARDGKYAGLSEDPRPFYFRPMFQAYTGSTSLIVRGTAAPQSLVSTIRNEVLQLDPQMAISTARTLTERLSLPMLPARIAAGLLGSFGVLALGLAAIGIYGVMSYSVSTRRREMGIRIALGAEPGRVLMLVLTQGMRLVIIGAAVGLAASLVATRLMKSLLFGISATDPMTFVAITLLLGAVALLACGIPALRATKVDPIVALRYE